MPDMLARWWQQAVAHAAERPARFEALTDQELLSTVGAGGSAFRAGQVVSPGPFEYQPPHVPHPSPGKVASSQQGIVVWLRDVVARASLLHEHSDSDWLTSASSECDPGMAERIRRWMAFIAPDGDPQVAMARFQLWQGLDEEAVVRAVIPMRMQAHAPLPAWAATLREALFEHDYGDPLAICDSRFPLPFESLHLTFISVFRRHLLAEIPDLESLLTLKAQADLARGLLVLLTLTACEALDIEFQCYRFAGFGPLLPLIASEPDAVFRRFIGEMQDGGLRAFYASYPVLARLQAILTDLAVETTVELAARLRADLPEICRRWRIPAPALVEGINDALGDRHQGGRRVMALTFSDQTKVIYKPKALGIDGAYNDLLAWLNRNGAPASLRPVHVLARDGYGWVEYVAPEACREKAAIERYYQRVGALACLAYLLQGSDCHAENLIAAGEHPVLVDCETLLSPRPLSAVAHGGRWETTTQHLIRDSVLTSSLLPGLGADGENRRGAPCGICDGQREPRERGRRWMDINTDRMTLRLVYDLPRTANNVPRVDAALAYAEDYVDEICAGFTALYRFLTVHRSALLDPVGPLVAFRGQFVRFIFRDTRIYGTILLFALGSAHLHNGVDFGLAFELLARALLTSDSRPLGWPILATECRALVQMDIPLLGAYTDRVALELEDGQSVGNYFVRPSYEALLEKTQTLNEADLAFQVGLLRSAIQEDVLRRRSASQELGV